MSTRHEIITDSLYAAIVAWAIDGGWRETSRTKVAINDVWRIYQSVYRRVESDDDAVTALQKCLIALVEQGLVIPLKENNREKITLPVAIWLQPTVTRVKRIVPSMPRWHHELYDLADAWSTATPKQRIRYSTINRWLVSNPDFTPVPLRERALEIFGTFGQETDIAVPEKALDGMRSGPLFGDKDRLCQVLRAFHIPPPLLTKQPLEKVGGGYLHRVGKGNLLVVVENSATWWSVVHTLPPHHNVGYVAWGLGKSFTASIHSIADNHEVSEVRYFGDLDVSGVRIPYSASHIANNNGLPPVQPAANLYSDLLAFGHSWRGTEKALDESQANELVAWLKAEHQRPVAQLLTSGRRIPQEWVGFRHLRQTKEWHADLV